MAIGKRRFGKARGPKRKKTLSARQKAIIFERCVDYMRTNFVRERARAKLTPEGIAGLGKFLSLSISPKKVPDYIKKLDAGEIFTFDLGQRLSFTVLPDGFLTKAEQKSLQRRIRAYSPDRKVLTAPEFKKWVLEKVDFGELERFLNFPLH